MMINRVDPRFEMATERLRKIGRVILVCSTKGGVGKSTVAAGLALGLSEIGRKVGLLDLDVHGTSLGRILNVRAPLRGDRSGIRPTLAQGIKVMSVYSQIGGEPVPVMGSELESLVIGLLSQTNWGELDYLVVDMPPGMGGELMAVLRVAAPVSEALLVTTPSKMSLEVVRRMVSLLKGERVTMLGVVQSMSYVSCTSGEVIRPFGRISDEEGSALDGIEMLAELPIDPDLERVLEEGLGVMEAPLLRGEFVKLSRLVDEHSREATRRRR